MDLGVFSHRSRPLTSTSRKIQDRLYIHRVVEVPIALWRSGRSRLGSSPSASTRRPKLSGLIEATRIHLR